MGSTAWQGRADYFNTTVCPNKHAKIVGASAAAPTDFVVALAAGRIDGFLLDPISAQQLLAAKKNLHSVGTFLQPGTGFVGWIVPHNNHQLALKLQAGLKHVIATGQYARIVHKAGLDPLAYAGASINAATK